MSPLSLGAVAAAIGLLAAPALVGSTPAPSPVIPQAPPHEAVWPVAAATVLTEFDDPLPYQAGHRGLDLAASVGEPVHAALPGTVSVAGQVAGRPLVVVQHADGLRTTYLPVIPGARVGSTVEAGAVIGTVATSGHCLSAACLHWGARHGERYIDPRSLLPLAAGPIVLLPEELS